MLSLRVLPSRRAAQSLCATCLRTSTHNASRPLSLLSASSPTRSRTLRLLQRQSQHATSTPPSSSITPPSTSTPSISRTRGLATKSTADTLIEDIQEQYATARDEFEIATEETEKKTLYAADDRAAAREELDKLKEMFARALEGPEGEEIKRRVGQRVRELDSAVQGLEQSAVEH